MRITFFYFLTFAVIANAAWKADGEYETIFGPLTPIATTSDHADEQNAKGEESNQAPCTQHSLNQLGIPIEPEQQIQKSCFTRFKSRLQSMWFFLVECCRKSVHDVELD